MDDKIIEITHAAWRVGIQVGVRAVVCARGSSALRTGNMRQHNPASGLPLIGDGSRDVKGNSWGTLDAQLEC